MGIRNSKKVLLFIPWTSPFVDKWNLIWGCILALKILGLSTSIYSILILISSSIILYYALYFTILCEFSWTQKRCNPERFLSSFYCLVVVCKEMPFWKGKFEVATRIPKAYIFFTLREQLNLHFNSLHLIK